MTDGSKRLHRDDAQTLKTIAAEAFAALGGAGQIPPFSTRRSSSSPGLSVDDAYRVTPLLRQMYEASGATAVGRKIGFTNRTIWAQYGVYAPIWGHVFDRSVHDLATVGSLPLAPFSEPRIEPEIVFGLAAAPSPDMDETALSSCIAWVALGYEIVQSIFPGWKFAASDTIAANGVHGALLIGPRHPYPPRAAEWQRTLSAFEIDLSCNGRLVDRGHAANVLDGPLGAAPSCRSFGRRSRQSAARCRRDRQHRHPDQGDAGLPGRDLDRGAKGNCA
jgi:2-keto-4-pentenoate hydratase